MNHDVEKMFEGYEISLAKFLSRYVLLSGVDLKKLTHEDVKVLFPDIRRCSIEKIRENPSLIYSREVILVYDGRHHIPYYPPEVLSSEITQVELDVVEEDKGLDNNVNYDYTSMSNYELKCVLKNKFNSYKNKRKAKYELENRGIILEKRLEKKIF